MQNSEILLQKLAFCTDANIEEQFHLPQETCATYVCTKINEKAKYFSTIIIKIIT